MTVKLMKFVMYNFYRDSRHWIRDVKFCPDGSMFALASMDHKIFIYSTENYRLRGLCEKHNSFVKNFDFSEDGKFIQSDSGDHEHLFFESPDGSHYSIGSNLVSSFLLCVVAVGVTCRREI